MTDTFMRGYVGNHVYTHWGLYIDIVPFASAAFGRKWSNQKLVAGCI